MKSLNVSLDAEDEGQDIELNWIRSGKVEKFHEGLRKIIIRNREESDLMKALYNLVLTENKSVVMEQVKNELYEYYSSNHDYDEYDEGFKLLSKIYEDLPENQQEELLQLFGLFDSLDDETSSESEKSSETTETLIFEKSPEISKQLIWASMTWKKEGSTQDVEKILWATNDVEGDPDTLYFLVKMKERDDPGLLRAEVANVKIPQLVIGFYESRLNWGK